MLNRKNAPLVQEFVQLDLPNPELIHLDNGIPVYILDYPGQEIVKIEIVFRAGRPQEQKRMVARACARMLREGSLQNSGADISEFFDFYGATLNAPSNLDTTNLALFCLKKYTDILLPKMAEVLLEPAFPTHELNTFCRTGIQELMVDLEKVEIQAYRKITELIFGENHPYGYNSTPEDFRALQREDLQIFYNQWFTPQNAILVASGSIDARIRALLNQCLGQFQRTGLLPQFHQDVLTSQPSRMHLPHPGSLQTAIKIGRSTFTRQHPDAYGFFVLNTILGGYFGSRLMANIREKRGYTYNIYASSDHYLHGGCFYIATEVNREKTNATIKQIFAELRRLRETPVAEEELHMVRNYLLGMMLNGLDGPLNTADVIKGLVLENQNKQDFQYMVETIRNISAPQIQELAQRYLQEKDLWVVTAGG
ncbi:MAG: insulinase family protein [Bacteroidetes bacterium]|nr:insulinase family protein [Bacteroidota bacterium]